MSNFQIFLPDKVWDASNPAHEPKYTADRCFIIKNNKNAFFIHFYRLKLFSIQMSYGNLTDGDENLRLYRMFEDSLTDGYESLTVVLQEFNEWS